MNMRVSVEVKLESGAIIHLTDPQIIQVNKYVEQMIMGAPVVKEKRKYVKREHKREWTKDEDDMVRLAMQEPLGKPRNKAYKFISATYNRSRMAVCQRATILRREARKTEPVMTPDWGLLGR